MKRQDCAGLLGKLFGHKFERIEKALVKRTCEVGTVIKHGYALYDYGVLLANGDYQIYDTEDVVIFYENGPCRRCGINI